MGSKIKAAPKVEENVEPDAAAEGETATKAPAKAKRSKSRLKAAKASKSSANASSSKQPAAKKSSAKTKKAAKVQEAEDSAAEAQGEEDDEDRPRMGVRGAAPWVARHAAKHAAEARARAAQPPPPGSARATIRQPSDIDGLKAKVIALHNHVERIKTLRKNAAENFYEIGRILEEIREQEIYRAKGFANFEAFVDREVDMNKAVALRLARIPSIFQEEAAKSYGVDALFDAMTTLESGADEKESPTATPLPSARSRPRITTRSPIVR